jgi:hypothetical protein
MRSEQGESIHVGCVQRKISIRRELLSFRPPSSTFRAIAVSMFGRLLFLATHFLNSASKLPYNSVQGNNATDAVTPERR